MTSSSSLLAAQTRSNALSSTRKDRRRHPRPAPTQGQCALRLFPPRSARPTDLDSSASLVTQTSSPSSAWARVRHARAVQDVSADHRLLSRLSLAHPRTLASTAPPSLPYSSVLLCAIHHDNSRYHQDEGAQGAVRTAVALAGLQEEEDRGAQEGGPGPGASRRPALLP